MEDLEKMDKRFRNGAVIIIIIAILLLAIWTFIFFLTLENAHPLLLAIGIASLLAGILMFTRIQWVIWMKKTHRI